MSDGEAYKWVNAALNDVLLTGRFAGRPLYLSLDNETRDSLASELSIKAPDVEARIARIVGASLERSGDPYVSHRKSAERWKLFRKDEFPPFTAVLFALSHAAGLMASEEDFGATNYYDRLSAALDFPAPNLRLYGKSTLPLWMMFNAWLAANDFEYGRPTAKAFNSHVYVNFPQSQSVVRAGDRHLFHHLFKRFQLSSADDANVGEIKQYVASWVHSSASNDRLRSAWAKRELRERFCEIVLAELNEWSEVEHTSEINNAPVSRLSLACSFVQQFPKSRLNLYLGRTGELPVTARGSFTVPNGFEARLGNEAFGSLATLSPNPLDAVSGVLDAGISMASVNGGLSWKPRLVIPFRKSEDGPFWIETSRIGFGTNHLVLVKDIPRLRREVDGYLAEASSGLARLATPGSLPGLPEGWVAYTGMQILVSGLDMTNRKNIACLAPLQDETGIVPDGGLRLDRGIWHSHRPPSLNFMASVGPTRLAVTKYGDEEEEALAFNEGQGRQARIEADLFERLGPGEYTVSAQAGGKKVSDATIILRSASFPRPMSRQGRGILEYENPVSAGVIHGLGACEGKHNSLAGLQVGSAQDAVLQTGQLPEGSVEAAAWNVSRPLMNAGGPATCVMNGYHYWRCDTPDPGAPRSAPVLMECTKCGQSVLTRNRGKKVAQAKMKASPPEPWSPSNSKKDQIDHDLILDALCFLGTGTMARFESLLASEVEEPWKVSQVAAQYSALGFIDLERDQATGRIKAWSVPAPVIVFRDDGSAVYSGFRSRETCASLRSLVAALGGVAEFTPIAGRPAIIEVNNVSKDAFQEAVLGQVDPLGRPWEVIPDITAHYVGLFERLEKFGMALSRSSIATGDVNARFDTRAAKWVHATGGHEPGALRAGFAGRTYAYKDPSGACVSGAFQLVKLLAARLEGVRLHHFQASTNVFLSTLGAEPLGLYERALVSSSGALPRISGGLLHYSNVPTALGQFIIHQLYEASLI